MRPRLHLAGDDLDHGRPQAPGDHLDHHLARALLNARRQRLGLQENLEDFEHRLGPIERFVPPAGSTKRASPRNRRLIDKALKQLSRAIYTANASVY
jgi:hypothetical protein